MVDRLKEKMVFRFKDESAGDFKGLLCFVNSIRVSSGRLKQYFPGKMFHIVMDDGSSDHLNSSEMSDIDLKSIRLYDPDIDPDFRKFLM